MFSDKLVGIAADKKITLGFDFPNIRVDLLS
jgi:hypothetical protein